MLCPRWQEAPPPSHPWGRHHIQLLLGPGDPDHPTQAPTPRSLVCSGQTDLLPSISQQGPAFHAQCPRPRQDTLPMCRPLLPAWPSLAGRPPRSRAPSTSAPLPLSPPGTPLTGSAEAALPHLESLAGAGCEDGAGGGDPDVGPELWTQVGRRAGPAGPRTWDGDPPAAVSAEEQNAAGRRPRPQPSRERRQRAVPAQRAMGPRSEVRTTGHR